LTGGFLFVLFSRSYWELVPNLPRQNRRFRRLVLQLRFMTARRIKDVRRWWSFQGAVNRFGLVRP
jgi:hypothetical protein